ncbi:MAG: hypothetical protein AB7E47_04065 [Desulfovibrionaceae bacterium]
MLFKYFFAHNVVVFLRPKLITVDAVLPLCMELKQRYPKSNVLFCVPNDSWPDTANENGLRTWNLLQRNTTLWDGMRNVGDVLLYCSYYNKYRARIVNILQRLKAFSVVLLLLLISKKCCLIQFVEPTSRMMSMLTSLARIFGKAYSVESRMYVGETMQRIVEQHKDMVVQDSRSYVDGVISFSPSHFYREIGCSSKALLGCSHLFPSWKEYIRQESESFYREFYAEHPDLYGKKIVVFCLGIVGTVLQYGTYEMRLGPEGPGTLFLQAMDVLRSFDDDIVVFLKPHFVTNVPYVEAVVSSQNGGNFFVTYEHPEVLLGRAHVQLACLFSMTLWMGKMCGVPTIEFSDYSEMLLEVMNHSGYEPDAVDYFINNDVERLKNVIRSLVQSEPKANPAPSSLFEVDLSSLDTFFD